MIKDPLNFLDGYIEQFKTVKIIEHSNVVNLVF